MKTKNLMKRMISVLLVTVISISFFCGTSSAADRPGVNIAVEYASGEVILTMIYNNCYNVGSCDAQLKFDSDVLTFKDYENTSDADYSFFHVAASPEKGIMNVAFFLNHPATIQKTSYAPVKYIFTVENAAKLADTVLEYTAVCKYDAAPDVTISISGTFSEFANGETEIPDEPEKPVVPDIKSAELDFEIECVGDELRLTVGYINCIGLTSCDAQLKFDSAVLTFKDYEYTDDSINTVFSHAAGSSVAGVLNIGFFINHPYTLELSPFAPVCYIFTIENKAALTGTLLEMTAECNSDYSYVSINHSEAVGNIGGGDIPGGDIEKPEKVEKIAMGDIDGDNIVSSADARAILRYAVELEDLTTEQLAYANIDFDDSVSSSDARLALRISVDLETSEAHHMTFDGTSYSCTECDKSFTIHIHNYQYVACNKPKKCSCGVQSSTVVKHSLDDRTYTCKYCGFSIADAMEAIDDILFYTDKLSAYHDNAIYAYQRQNYSSYFDNAMGIAACYKLMAEAADGVDGLEVAAAKFKKAYDIIYGSFVYISYDGEHFYTNATNANYVLSYGMIPALDYEGEGLEEIKLFLEKYKDLVE